MSLDAYAFISDLQELKDFMKVEGTGDDAVLEAVVNGISAAMEMYCDRKFLKRDYDEQYDGHADCILRLKQYPLNSVSELYDDPDRDWDSATLISEDDYIIDSERGFIRLEGNLIFSRGRQNIRVKYNAGYSEIPHDLKLATLGWCAAVRKEQDENRWGITSVAIPGASMSYPVREDIPLPVKAVLDRYRKIR